MIIKDINIDGFGKFTDFTIDSLDQGVNIIHGKNEAGKSTLLKFIRFTLFGYPRRKNKRMKPTEGGDHGGRIKGKMRSGEQVVFERFSGSKGGDINLMYDGEETDDKDKWSKLLGEADKKLYENVYTFSLDELINIESLTESGVEDKIFSIGLGLGDTSIGDIEENIQQRTGELYNPQGSTQEVHQILDQVEQQKEVVNDIKNNLNSYQNLTEQKEDLADEMDEIKEELHNLKKERNKIEGALSSYESFLKIKKIDSKLKNLPDKKDLPNVSKEELKNITNQKEELVEKLEQIKQGREDQMGIEELKEKLDSIELNQELVEAENDIEYLRKNLEKYKQTKHNYEQTKENIADIKQGIETQLNRINTDWTEEDIENFSEIIQRKDKIKDFKNELDKIENKQQEAEAELKTHKYQSSDNNYKKISSVVGVIFLIIAISSFYYSAFFRAGAFVLATGIVFASIYLLDEKSKSTYDQQLQQIKQKKKKINKKYSKYISELNMNKDLSPEGALEVLNEIENLKQSIKNKKQARQKQEKQRKPFLNEFEQKVDKLKQNTNEKIKESDIYLTAGKIIDIYEGAKDKKQQQDKYKEKIQKLNKRRKRIKNKLNETKKEIESLLNSAEANSEKGLIKLYEQNNKIEQLQKNREQAVSTIEKIVGFNKSEEVINFLGQRDKQDLQAEISQLNKNIDQKEQDLEQKTSKLGEIKNELEQLEGESELAEAMTELESYKEKLSQARQKWLSGKLALRILSKIKNIYQKEKQPEMIKKASKYFKKITGENYERISVSLEDKEVKVFNSKGAGKNISELSRGTKEQLLTTLRLGFIEEYEKEAEPLPTVMDEVFVNFDFERAENTAEIVEGFAEDRQVLIFTCHPQTKDLFSNKVNTIEI